MTILKLYKRCLFVLALVIGSLSLASAQSPTLHGNEWIDYSKTYYKLKVVNTGLHRLSYGYLDSLGLGGTDPRHFQLFRRGKEVAIHVAGEADGRLDQQDFVEFYGERNDGKLDQDLYKNPAHQIHQLYSLYTDTAAYFLTVNPAGGKRMREINPAVEGKTPEPYQLQRVVRFFADRYYYGKKYGQTSSLLSWMDEGEGYASVAARGAKAYDILSVTNVAPLGPKPIVEYAVGGVDALGAVKTNLHGGALNVVLPSGGTRQIARFQIVGDGFVKGKVTIELSDIFSSGKVTVQTLPDATPTNDVTMSYIRLTFPQKTDFVGNSLHFFTDSTRAANPYFEFNNTDVNSISFDVTDPYNPIRIEGHMNGNKKGFVISSEQKTHKILLVKTTRTLKASGKTEVVRFRNIEAAAYNYIIVTNKRLMKSVSGTQSSAPAQFAAYRASVAGGRYDTLLVNMDQVVDLFHYGEFSSNAIRKFMTYMLTSERPKHLFIIGKGMKYAWDDYNSSYYKGKWSFYQVGARHPKVHEIDLVPTGMIPSSDIFFSADFRNERYEPRIPTGRLSVTNADQIIAYLNKVKEHEALPEGLAWRKNILQLGGGSTVPQMALFSQWLSNYKNIVQGPLFGGRVIEKYRHSLSDFVNYINVAEEVNAGVSLVTFFGHSSTNVSDLEIGFASENINGYRNKGKYPVILMNGCYSGDAFMYNNISFGEDWLMTPDRGAISFMSQSYIGGDRPLNEFSQRFYQVAFADSEFYGRTIGDIHRETIKRYNTASSLYRNNEDVATMTQMVLQGDPAVKPYAPSKPDYTFENNNFTIKDTEGEVATSSTEHLVLQLNVFNLGKAIPDSINVSVKRTLADNTKLDPLVIKVKPIFYKDRLLLTVPNSGIVAAGMNKFEIILDGTDQIDELDESNNILQIQHFLPSSGITLLAPMEYAIVNSSTVDLVVQSTQLRAEPKGVYFELDSVPTFNSSLRKTYQANAGVLPAWRANLPVQDLDSDSTVFYWRARFDAFAPGEDTVWVQSSFRYIKNSIGGWSQSHSGQFEKAELKHTVKDAKGKWDFSVISKNVEIRTAGGKITFDMPPHGIYINGVSEIDNACGNFKGTPSVSRMYFFVLDNQTLQHVRVPGFAPCRFMDNLYQYGDLANPTVRATVQRFLEAIPEGHFVIAMSVNNVPFDLFTPELKAAFRSVGSKLIDDLKTGYPFALIGQKGAAPGTAQELSAPATDQEISLTHQLQTRTTEGSITSTIIGPALNWGTLHHNIERFGEGNDSYKLSLYGIDGAGNRELLQEDIKSKTYSLESVKAEQYPNLQLMATLTDTEARTAPQLKQWMVYYQAAPEGVIRPDLVEVSEQLISEQASRGRFTVPMAFQNITPYAFRDSITVEVTVTGDGIQPAVSQFKIEPLEGNKTANFNYSMPTMGFDGNYRLSMYVNPRLQPEQQYQNNIYETNFQVKSKLHPIMDVAFDGVHIMDGELVSPSPLISITMKDENKHAFLQDPAAMSVILIDTEGQQRDITVGSNPNEVRVYPADEKNDFRFEYKPERLADGRYTLEVRGRDVTGKASGISPYRISFEVDNESKITNFYPYPNPFSSKTQFIFTLTGAVIPDDFKIQIMTVTGKIVKEIMREEIGTIRIGNNKTEYAWDGTDTYGDKLANGVYLYRVVMPQDTEAMKHIWKKGDKAFVNGYGKIYILR
jgi:hypothetical protein